MKLTAFIRLGIVGVLALLLSACACPLQKCPLRGATAAPVQTRPGDAFTGHYAGGWRSEVTGHRGRLYCDITKMDPKHYRADFKAYWGFLNGRYSVVLETRRSGRELRFAGRQDLGKIYGGVFKYDGKISGGRMTSTYASGRDHGSFDLTRQ